MVVFIFFFFFFSVVNQYKNISLSYFWYFAVRGLYRSCIIRWACQGPFFGDSLKFPENSPKAWVNLIPEVSPKSPKMLSPSPPWNLGIIGDRIPKNPRKRSFHHPQIVLEGFVKSIPVPTPSPNFGDRNGDPRVSRPRLQTLVCA